MSAEHIDGLHKMASFFGTFIGGITFTGSIAAFIKLADLYPKANLNIPHKELVSRTFTGVTAGMLALMLTSSSANVGLFALTVTTATSFTLGWNVIFSIGSADIPVAITVLNSYSGWALCAEGFMLNNNLLTIVGSLIGSSGAILSYIMCKAMNRSLTNVIFGGIV